MAEQFKYLAMKNWDHFQPKDTKSLPWIRDYKDKEFDHAYSSLTILQRYMLDACCRLRGRHGKNLPNDPLWICRATAVLPRERHNATTAIQQLINSGFLVPTNQQDSPLGEVSKVKERIEKTMPPLAVAKPVFQLPGWIEKQTWEDYEQMRRRIGKPMTDRARNLAVDRLAALQNKGHPVVEVLKQSIFNSWQGVFELKANGYGKQSKLDRTIQNLREIELEERSKAASAGNS